MDTTDLVDIPKDRGLEEFAPETPSPDVAATPPSLVLIVQADVSPESATPRPFSRVEAAQAKRAAALAATHQRRTVSSVTTGGGRAFLLVASRGRRAVSSVLEGCIGAVSTVAAHSRRGVSSVVRRSVGRVSAVATGCVRHLGSGAARGRRTAVSTAALTRQAASMAATQSRRAASSLARQSACAASAAAAHGRRGISTAASRSAGGASALGHEAAAVSRALMGYIWAAIALLALRCDSWAYAAARAVRAGRSRWASLRPDATTTPEAGLRHLESEGAVVAAALALAAVSYGAGALLLSWRNPEPRISEVAVSAPGAGPIAESPAAVHASVMTTGNAVPGDLVPPATVRPAVVRLSAASLKAVWNRGDTRSLHGALTNLRYQTLALHRCGMKMTAADRAVARCDGSNSARYTIDFRRTRNRWVIQRVSSR